jgi:hypothetical protein
MKPHSYDFSALASVCVQADPAQGSSQLLHRLQGILPQHEFEPVLTREGWYRLGGVVDRDGGRIADSLAEWVEAEAKGDVNGLYNKYMGQGLLATRLNGKTHYLVAQTGPRPQDYIQLEVEEVQEVLDRNLFDEEILPESIEELIDPLEYTRLEPKPLSSPRYLFRRIIPIADYLDDLIEKAEIKPPVVRFMADWERSSAGEAAPFCQHWVLSFREYTDGYGEPRFHAKPITTYTGEIPVIQGDPMPRGSILANLIHSFDRQIGYPMAWYFFMLSHKQVSHQIAEAIHKDLMGAYAYLPARDMKVLRDWYDRGYGV